MAPSEDTIWQVTLLGHLRAERNGVAIDRFQTKQTALLFAYLALHQGKHVPREFLCEQLWPESDPRSARGSLNQALSWLRGHFELTDTLRSSRANIELAQNAIRSDVASFEFLANSANSAGPESSLDKLRAAAKLYQGELLAGYADDWVRIERMILANTYLRTLRRLCDSLEKNREIEEAIDWAQVLVKQEPSHDEHYARLARLLICNGQSGAARRLVSDYERSLSSLGRNLSDELRMLLADGELPPQATPPSSTQPTKTLRHLNRFFGRQEEIRHVVELIGGGSRLITLLGISGVGKTRLSLEIAHQIETSFDEVAFVELPASNQTVDIVQLILERLGSNRVSDDSALHVLRERLQRSSKVLLILDNLDHVAQSASTHIRRLVQTVPNVFVLGTSIVPLAIPGEKLVHIGPLPVPSHEETQTNTSTSNPSVQLFVDRAKESSESFEITDQNRERVIELCQHLEGLPLAIELAASWASVLSPAETLKELSSRFELLANQQSGLPTRHLSLQSAFQYSFDLLPPDLSDALVQLSVFHGGWTLEAAEAVLQTNNTRGVMRTLAARALLVSGPDSEEDPTRRFSLLPSVSEFAARMLSSEDATRIRERHARYFLALAKESDQESLGPLRGKWARALSRDKANLQAARLWFEETGQYDDALRLATYCSWHWLAYGSIRETRTHLQSLLEWKVKHPDPVIAAQAYRTMGFMDLVIASFASAETNFAKALEYDTALSNELGAAADRSGIAMVALRLGHLERALGLLLSCIATYKAIHNEGKLAEGHVFIACVYCDLGSYPEAKEHFDLALKLESKSQNAEGIARIYCNLTHWAHIQERYDLARHYTSEALRILAPLGHLRGMTIAKTNLARVAVREHKAKEALPILNESLSIYADQDDAVGVVACITELTILAEQQSAYSQGARLMSLADVLCERVHSTISPPDLAVYRTACASIRAHIAPEICESMRSLADSYSTTQMAQACREGILFLTRSTH